MESKRACTNAAGTLAVAAFGVPNTEGSAVGGRRGIQAHTATVAFVEALIRRTVAGILPADTRTANVLRQTHRHFPHYLRFSAQIGQMHSLKEDRNKKLCL